MVERRKIGGVYIEIEGENRDYKRKVRESGRVTKTETNRMQGDFRRTGASARALNSDVQRLSGALAGLGAATVAFAGAQGIRRIANFEQAMSTVKAVTQATDSQMKALEAQAKVLGSTTRFSASQAAEGMIFLARAGFSVEEVLGSIEGALNLAQAGELDLARAADIASNVLSGFNLEVSEAARVMDVLAAAANASNTDINQLGEALKFAAPQAVALGLDLESTVALIGKLSDAGILAGLAGRGFNSLTTQMIKNEDKIKDLIGEYDLVEDGVDGVIAKLQQAGITTAQIARLFGGENVDAFTILANSAGDAEGSVGALETVLRRAAGTAERVARTMDDNLNGALLAAGSALEALILALGEVGTSDGVRTALGGLADLLRLAADNADILAIAFVAMTTRAIIPLAASLSTALVGAIAKARAEMIILEGIAGRSIGTLGRLRIALSAFGGPVTLAITAAAAAMAAIALNSKSAADRLSDVDTALNNYRTTNEKIREDTTKLETLQNNLVEAIEKQGPAAEETARLEIDAVRRRIEKNKELAQTYVAIARAQLAQANESIVDDRRSALRRGTNILGNRRALQVAQEASANGESFPLAVIDAARDEIFAKQDRGEVLSNSETKFLELISTIELAESKAREAREVIDDILNPDTVATPTSTTTTDDDTGTTRRTGRKTAAELAKEEEEKKRAKERTAILQAEDEERRRQAAELLKDLENNRKLQEAQLALDIAMTDEDEKAIEKARENLAILEDQILLEELIAEYKAAGVKDAEDRAQAEVDALRALQDQLVAAEKRADKRSDEDDDKFFDEGDLRDRTKRAVIDAVSDGDLAGALEDALAGAVTSAFEKSIEDAIDIIFDAFKNIDFSGGFGGGLGSFFGNIFGGRAGGGSVKAGQAYVVGERGSEFFVPAVDGFVVPNAPTSSGQEAAVSGGVGGVTIQTVLQVEGNLVEDTVQVIDERLAAYSQSLPGVIDNVVRNGQRRGRYG